MGTTSGTTHIKTTVTGSYFTGDDSATQLSHIRTFFAVNHVERFDEKQSSVLSFPTMLR
jgi:hypothetical protein